MTKIDNLYADYPEEYQALAIEQEARVIAKCSQSPALSVQLPAVLAEYRAAALALLHVVRTQREQPSGLSGHLYRNVFTSEFTLDALRTCLEREANISIGNAAKRVMKAEYYAAQSWKAIQEAAQRAQRAVPMMAAQDIGDRYMKSEKPEKEATPDDRHYDRPDIHSLGQH
jgi:hypothetical protein